VRIKIKNWNWIFEIITIPSISAKCIEGSGYGYLCTGASFYAPYSLLLISSKFWMGGRGKVGSWWGRSEGTELEGENKKGGGGE
jgi:hypothetical protein